ncbi:hypothetical protein ACWCOW_15260 [Streptomyces sp. NPDC001939]
MREDLPVRDDERLGDGSAEDTDGVLREGATVDGEGGGERGSRQVRAGLPGGIAGWGEFDG